MKKSSSYSFELNSYEEPSIIRKSRSCSCFTNDDLIYEDFFEGDGKLGIGFKQNTKNEIYVHKITDNTVASEYYDLKLDMILLKINDVSIHGKSFSHIVQKINKFWDENNQICLQFKKNINQTIYESLKSIDYLEYYDHFIKLGVKDLDDYEFVEYSDLVEMKIPKEKIKSFQKLNKKINPELYDFCKSLNISQYYEGLIDMGVEKYIDFELIEYNDLKEINMDDKSISQLSKTFRSIKLP